MDLGLQFRRWTHTSHYITTHHVVSGRNPTRPAHNHTLSKQSSIKQHYKIKKCPPPPRPAKRLSIEITPTSSHQRLSVSRFPLPQILSSYNESVIKWNWEWRLYNDIFTLGDKSKEFC